MDGYDPYTGKGEIVSRKATDLNKLSEDRFRNYLSEFESKYANGIKKGSNKYPEIDGLTINRQYILETPASNANLSNIEYYKKIAEQYSVILRFFKE